MWATAVLYRGEAASGIELIVLTALLVPIAIASAPSQSALLVPIAMAPTRYWSYCWLAIFCNAYGALYWTVVARTPQHRMFIFYALVHFFLALAMMVSPPKKSGKDSK